jgi:ABC-2 type transport system ATP-binding protein
VSIDVPPGTIFGLLGPNGAGKTTLVKILLGVVYPSSGEARIFGTPSTDPAARQRLGFLPENHRFPEFLTARQMLNVYGQMSAVEKSEREARIPELLERVGLDHAADAKMKTFSKGMLQRAGLAQALLNEPDLLFLDEPTDGVDPVGRREIRDILVWLKDQGKTVFLNSHLLSEVEKVCTQVAILNKGELVRTGTVEELTAVEHAYDLTCTPVPGDVADALGDRLEETGSSPDDLRRYRARPDDRADLNALIDRLRSAGVELESVQPLRQSLEDYFVDVVGVQVPSDAGRSVSGSSGSGSSGNGSSGSGDTPPDARQAA